MQFSRFSASQLISSYCFLCFQANCLVEAGELSDTGGTYWFSASLCWFSATASHFLHISPLILNFYIIYAATCSSEIPSTAPACRLPVSHLLFFPIRLSCCIVSHPVALYCKDCLHFVNGLFKSDKAEEEEAYVPDVCSFLSLSTRSSRSRSTSLVVAAIMYKRSSCIGCRVIHISKTNSHKEQTTTESEYSEAQVREGRRPTAEKKSGTWKPKGGHWNVHRDVKRFNEAHKPRVTVRRTLLWGKTLRSVSAEGQEEGELTCDPPCISSSSSSNPNTLPPLWSFCPENLSKITFSTFFFFFFFL